MPSLLRPGLLLAAIIFFPFAALAAPDKPLCPSEVYRDSLPCRLQIISSVEVTVPTSERDLAARIPQMKALIRKGLKTGLPFLSHESLSRDGAWRKFRTVDQMLRRGAVDCSVVTGHDGNDGPSSLMVQCLLWSYADHARNRRVLSTFHSRLIGMAPRKDISRDVERALARNIQKIADAFKSTRLLYRSQQD